MFACCWLFAAIQIELPWKDCPFNYTLNATEPECKSPTTYFWYHTTLDASPSMEDTGGLKWWIVLCLFAAWAIVFLIVMKGIQSSGNVSNQICMLALVASALPSYISSYQFNDAIKLRLVLLDELATLSIDPFHIHSLYCLYRFAWCLTSWHFSCRSSTSHHFFHTLCWPFSSFGV